MKIQVTRSAMPSFEEYCEEIREFWDTRWITNMGEKHRQLQRELEEYLGVDHIELLTNGHMALEMTLQAMELEGEVITTPFTFASTTHAIVRSGLEPVFCDIDPLDFTIDPAKIEEKITEKTCAILPVHIYGNVCHMDEIERIAEKYHLKVICDAAHTFGETYRGQGVGRLGDASCFSFHATKVFHTIEGGAVAFSDKRLGEKLYDLKNFGIHGPEDVTAVGANAKMNEFCAAMGICNLRHIDEGIKRRGQIVRRYREQLEEIPGLQLNVAQEEVTSNHAYFPVLFDEEEFGAGRDEVYDALRAQGIGARKYFYPLTNAFSAYQGRFDPEETPAALRVSRQVLTLPLYEELAEEDVDRICEIILRSKQ